jgi:glycosyltransferase involved in cell wall biosynthesis
LLHAHLHSASVAAAVAARVSGLPLVLTHHSMNTWRPAAHRLLGRWADRQADAIIAVATNAAASCARGGVRPHLIPNGIRLPASVLGAVEIAAARARRGVPAEAYLISFVGRFSEDKNPLLFVEAAGRLAARCPQAHFLLIGDGPLRLAAETRARALGIEHRLTFTGYLSDAASLHGIADVLALTSNSECSPLVVLEAMAAQRPVVATAVGDVPRQVVHGKTGFVVAPRDVEGLANGLLLLASESLRRHFGRAARERVAIHFQVDQGLAQMAAVYRHVVARRPRAVRQRAEPLTGFAPLPPARLAVQDRPVEAERLADHLVHAEPAADAVLTGESEARA